jgi:hypothetical protein
MGDMAQLDSSFFSDEILQQNRPSKLSVRLNRLLSNFDNGDDAAPNCNRSFGIS